MDHYEQVEVLGQGSFGTAYLVREKKSGRRGVFRVVKEINLPRMPQQAQREAQAEARVLKALSHVNVIAYFDAFMEGPKLHIVMEFADGGDLAAAVKRRREEGGRFNQDEALVIFAQCCLALQHIHARHVLHRDLKTQNIFLTKAGVVKLGDFGIAKVLDHTAGQAVTVIGTPGYLPPEVCNNRPYGIKADVWALGVVLYELLALEAPFQGVNLAALVVKIVTTEPAPVSAKFYGEEIRGLITKCLQKKPDSRPSADELMALPVVRHGRALLPPALAEELRPASAPRGGAGNAVSEPPLPEQRRARKKSGDATPSARGELPACTPRRPSKPHSLADRGSGDAVDKFLFGRDVFAVAKRSEAARCPSPGRPRTPSTGSTPDNAARRESLPPATPRGAAAAAGRAGGRDAALGTPLGGARPRTPGTGSTPSSARRAPPAEAVEDRRASEEQHRQALAEASAQARRDRKMIQAKLQDLDVGGGKPELARAGACMWIVDLGGSPRSRAGGGCSPRDRGDTAAEARPLGQPTSPHHAGDTVTGDGCASARSDRNVKRSGTEDGRWDSRRKGHSPMAVAGGLVAAGTSRPATTEKQVAAGLAGSEAGSEQQLSPDAPTGDTAGFSALHLADDAPGTAALLLLAGMSQPDMLRGVDDPAPGTATRRLAGDSSGQPTLCSADDVATVAATLRPAEWAPEPATLRLEPVPGVTGLVGTWGRGPNSPRAEREEVRCCGAAPAAGGPAGGELAAGGRRPRSAGHASPRTPVRSPVSPGPGAAIEAPERPSGAQLGEMGSSSDQEMWDEIARLCASSPYGGNASCSSTTTIPQPVERPRSGLDGTRNDDTLSDSWCGAKGLTGECGSTLEYTLTASFRSTGAVAAGS